MATHPSKRYEILSRAQAAELAGVSRQRVSQAVQEGTLAYIPFGLRCTKFYRKDVLQWIKNKRRAATKFRKGYCVPL